MYLSSIVLTCISNQKLISSVQKTCLKYSFRIYSHTIVASKKRKCFRGLTSLLRKAVGLGYVCDEEVSRESGYHGE